VISKDSLLLQIAIKIVIDKGLFTFSGFVELTFPIVALKLKLLIGQG